MSELRLLGRRQAQTGPGAQLGMWGVVHEDEYSTSVLSVARFRPGGNCSVSMS